MEYVLFNTPKAAMPPLSELRRILESTEVIRRLLRGEPVELLPQVAAALKTVLSPSTLYSVEEAKRTAPRVFLGAEDTLFVHFRGREVYIPPIPHVGNWAVCKVTNDARLWRDGRADVYTPYDQYGVLAGLIGATDQVDAEVQNFFDNGKQFSAIKEVFETTPLPFYEREWHALSKYTPLRGDSPEAVYWRAHVVWRTGQIVELLRTEGESGFEYPDDPEVGNTRYLHALKYECALQGGE